VEDLLTTDIGNCNRAAAAAAAAAALQG